MSNSYFNPVVVRTSQVQDISTSQNIVIQKGPASTTYQEFMANTESVNSVNFNVALPSESVLMNREVLVETELELTFTIPINAGYNQTGQSCFNYGFDNAFSAFPLNSLILSATATINNSSVSTNIQDIMHVLLRSYNDEDFQKYNSPTMVDKRLRNYADMAASQGNPLSNFANSDTKVPRGAHPISYIKVTRVGGATPTTVVRESGVNTQAEINDNLKVPSNHACSWEIVIRSTVQEPLLFLSPFQFAKNNNNAALYSVNNLNLTLNLDSSAKHTWSSGSLFA